MPYFVYRIHRYGGLERVDALASFRDASARAKASWRRPFAQVADSDCADETAAFASDRDDAAAR